MSRIRGQEIDSVAVYQYWLDSPVFSVPRPTTKHDDFGDQETVGKHLKRRYIEFSDYEEYDFAIYLGKHESVLGTKYIVGIKNYEGNRLISGESFNSLEELKEAWILD